LTDATFGAAPSCPALQSIGIQSYGWGRARALVPRHVRARAIALFWLGITAERHCAPGGSWALRDEAAYRAEFGA